MSEQEVPLGYFEGPEGDIVCLIKSDKEAQYTFGKVIRFNPKEMTLYRLYHKNIVEVAASYRDHCRELEKSEAQKMIETFEKIFEKTTGYKYRSDKKP